MKIFPRFCAAIIYLCTIHLFAQQNQNAQDSVSTNQKIKTDSLIATSRHNVQYNFKKDSIDWFDYNSLAYVVRFVPGVSLHELGTYGHPTTISLNGSNMNQSSLSRGIENFDDMITGIPDPNFIAIEATDSLVVYPQHQAFYFGGNGKLFSANAIEKQYDAPRPYSRIRHVEAPDDYLFTDVIFSVNPTEKSNLMTALTRQSSGSTGFGTTSLDMRLPNSGYEAWNIRGAYRIKFSEGQSLVLKDHYDHFIRMYNGGVNPYSTSILIADSAFGLTPSLINTTMQDDIVRNRIESEYAFHLFGDSIHTSKLNLSYTSNVQTFLDRMDRSPDSLTRLNSKTVWDNFQLSFEHESEISHLAFNAGGSVNRYQIRRSPYITGRSGFNVEAHGKLELTIGQFSTDVFGRIENKFGFSTLGLGATATTHIYSNFSFWIGSSFSQRSPTLFETSWISARIFRGNETYKNESILIGESGVQYSSSFAEVDLRGFYRSIENPIESFISQTEINLSRFMTEIISNNSNNYYIHDVGATLNCQLNFWRFHSESRIGITKPISQNTVSNYNEILLSGNTEIYFRDVLIKNALELKAGMRCDFSSSDIPYAMNPETGMYGFLSSAEYVKSIVKDYNQYAAFSLYLIAKVKTATLHFIMQNLFDTRYITTSFYPMYDRGFRFGVSWAFFD